MRGSVWTSSRGYCARPALNSSVGLTLADGSALEVLLQARRISERLVVSHTNRQVFALKSRFSALRAELRSYI
jgi:hypothetical protein